MILPWFRQPKLDVQDSKGWISVTISGTNWEVQLSKASRLLDQSTRRSLFALGLKTCFLGQAVPSAWQLRATDSVGARNGSTAAAPFPTNSLQTWGVDMGERNVYLTPRI
jgi:hypothetical protein